MSNNNNIPETPLQLTDCMEIVINQVRNEGINEESLQEVRNELDCVNDYFETTDIQSIIFIAILEESFEVVTSMKSLARTLRVSNIRFLGMKKEIKVLLSKRLVRETKDRRENITYKVPLSVITAIQDGEKPNSEDITDISAKDIFRHLHTIFKDIHNDKITPEAGHLEIIEICNHNLENEFIKKCKEWGISRMMEQEQMIAFYMLHRLYSFKEDVFTIEEFDKILFKDNEFTDTVLTAISEGKSPLFSNDIIEFRCDDGQINNSSFVLTDGVKSDLMKDIVPQKSNISTVEEKVPSDELVKASSINEKQLFYNDEEAVQVSQLEHLLQEENFAKVRERLLDKGLSRGFTALFYGAPGTGKTASVFELARRSGRDIYFVDQSKLRSKWHGESEKALKGLFKKYKELVKTASLCPILVLNECDSIMNKRSEQTESVNSQLNNSLVNIILNELDDFDGIMIATSNLAGGLDSAFERRLLFKVQFNKPGKEVRAKIWESKIQELSLDDIDTLAQDYSFSGGQIDNIARKVNIDYVLSGKSPNLESVDKLCSNEKIKSNTTRKRIGF